MSIINSISGFLSSSTSSITQIFSSIQIENKIGLLALLLLVPFVILYLIRPKPKSTEMPSLMFFMKTKGRSIFSSFLRHILKDILFLIQLLILLMLLVPISSPYTEYDHDVSSRNTVIVLDVSASMQTLETGGKSRLQIAKEHAISKLGKQNTLILAKSTQFLAMQGENSDKTAKFIKSLRASSTPSKIGEATLLAGELLNGHEGKLIVISDFINTNGINPNNAKSILESKGINVEFINVGSNDRKNIGIIDLIVKEKTSTAFIKNYNSQEEQVSVIIGEEKRKILIPAKSTHNFKFKTPNGQSTIKLDISSGSDDFKIDNTIYLSTPTNPKTKILLVTNEKSKFLESALKSSPNVELTISTPPIISKKDYDLYIIHNVDSTQILPGTFQDILRKIKKGASVIVHAQDNSLDINYKGLLAINLISREKAVPLTTNQKTRFTKNIEFGMPNIYFTTKEKNDINQIVSAQNSSIIAYKNYGSGQIVYYGILETESDFKLSPYYPIFWNELIKFLTGQTSLKTSHKKTGEIQIINGELKTPLGNTKTQAVLLEETGFYTSKNTIAVNLLNPEESQINLDNYYAKKILDVQINDTIEKRKYYIEGILIFIAMILLLIELLALRRRGDI